MKIQVIDICGRKAPETVELSDAADYLGLGFDDVEFIMDGIADCGVAYIGEIEYREVA